MKSFINHKELLDSIPPKVRAQLRNIFKGSGLPDNEASFRKVLEAWLFKRAIFNKIIEHGNFKKVKSFDKNNKNGCIAITLSGSVLVVSPLMNGSRNIHYTSINHRTDVPKVLEVKGTNLENDAGINQILKFTSGAMKQTSEIIDIGVTDEISDIKEQFDKIIEISQLLQDNFIQINKYTFRANYFDDELRDRNDLFLKWIVIDWFVIGGFDKHVFLARAKILWLEFFTKLYQELSKRKDLKEQKDELFLQFTNERFAKFIDDYKWYESERKDFDIGLMKALEEIPAMSTYWDFLNEYCNNGFA